ncbi:MAG: DMT family transporter [Alphaproteobacteria bacterium]
MASRDESAVAGVSVGRESERWEITKGIILIACGVSLFPFMNAAVKLLGAHYPANEIVWARFTGHLIVILAVFLPRYGWRLLATRRPAVQIGRGLLMLIGNVLFVIAIAHVPLATAAAIGFTAPLIVTALAGPLLREHVGIRRWSAVLVGFAGALVIIRPGVGFGDPMLLLLLLGSATHALYLIATRWVGNYDDPATSIVHSALIGSLIMSLVLPFSFVWPRDAFDLAMLGSLGLIGAAGHYLVIRAFHYGPAAVIAPLSYVELVGTAALGYLIFDNFPDLWIWVGAAIIIASGLYIALRERRLRAAGR